MHATRPVKHRNPCQNSFTFSSDCNNDTVPIEEIGEIGLAGLSLLMTTVFSPPFKNPMGIKCCLTYQNCMPGPSEGSYSEIRSKTPWKFESFLLRPMHVQGSGPESRAIRAAKTCLGHVYTVHNHLANSNFRRVLELKNAGSSLRPSKKDPKQC